MQKKLVIQSLVGIMLAISLGSSTTAMADNWNSNGNNSNWTNNWNNNRNDHRDDHQDRNQDQKPNSATVIYTTFATFTQSASWVSPYQDIQTIKQSCFHNTLTKYLQNNNSCDASLKAMKNELSNCDQTAHTDSDVRTASIIRAQQLARQQRHQQRWQPQYGNNQGYRYYQPQQRAYQSVSYNFYR